MNETTHAAGSTPSSSSRGGGRRESATPLRIYKPGQGTYTRLGTTAAGALLSLGLAQFVSDELVSRFVPSQNQLPWVVGAWLGTLLLCAFGMYRVIGLNRTVVDFMIATEGEMKKVNWSSWREVIGATKVVIVTVLAMGALLFLVDLVFMFFFSLIGVLKLDLIGQLFRGPAGGS